MNADQFTGSSPGYEDDRAVDDDAELTARAFVDRMRREHGKGSVEYDMARVHLRAVCQKIEQDRLIEEDE